MRPLYKETNHLIYKLHPFTIVFFIFGVFLLSLVFTHPLYLIGLMLVTLILIIDSGNLDQWKGYMKISFMLVIMIIIVNAIFVNAGATVLYNGPRLPVIGKVRITLEALAYGAGMGLRLLVIMSVFCFYTYTVQPDKFMKLFSRFGNKSVFVIALSMRLFPLMIDDYRRITEVQRCRGVKMDNNKLIGRIKNLLPITSVLLLSSLERSFQQAESMYAKGYGSGRRSTYRKEIWRLRDYLILAMTAMGIITGIYASVIGYGKYEYYPRLTAFNIKGIGPLVAIMLAFIFPVLLNWGWKRWRILRLKI